ncbi:MAG: hypothetical protein PHC61_10675 [Chitinivibrionales bacterium]|nr:hypothetical protein [Chitinivibrionales bacterium]
MKLINKIAVLLSWRSTFCAVGLVLGFLSAALPQVTLDSNGYVFMHPFFTGKNWKATLTTTDIALPDTLATLRPRQFDIGLMPESTTALFSTRAGDLYSMAVYGDHFVGSCITDLITFNPPRAVTLASIAFTAASPWYLVKELPGSLDTVRLACAPSAQRMLVLSVRPSTGAIVRIDTCVISDRGQNQRPFAIAGVADSLTGQDNGLLVLGSSGMVRFFAIIGPHQFGAEIVRDIATGDTVRCAYGAFCGTSSGKIYKLNAQNAYVLQAGLSGPVNAIVKRGAVGNNGLAAEYTNGSWRGYTLGSANYRQVNFIRRGKGFGLETLDTNWVYHVYSYRDTASTIAGVLPAALAGNINGPAYQYTGDSLRIIKLIVNDPDSNYSDVSLKFTNGIDLKSDGLHVFDTLPDTLGCRPGSLRLASDTIVLSLTRDSIKAAWRGELGAMNVSCLFPYWKKYSFTAKTSWLNYGAALMLKTGASTFTIRYGASASARPPAPAAAIGLRMAFLGRERCLIIDITEGQSPRLASITLYDACGRTVMLYRATNMAGQIVPLPQRSAVLFGKCIFTDGSSKSVPLPLVK